MNEAILGVIVGGILTGSGTWIALWLQHKKWKIEQKIRFLENKRDRIESLSHKTLENLATCMKENLYGSQMMSDLEFLFPECVSNEFKKFMEIKNKNDGDKKFAYFNIEREMKKTISEIEIEIKALLN